ncbi:MAG: zinc ribbon domain-containing protein [Promethearchaeota archaeon]
MPKFCVYCGNPVKPTDKFCIACGKPMLSSSSQDSRKMSVEKSIKQEEEIQAIVVEEPEVIDTKEEEIEEKEEMEDEIEKDKKKIEYNLDLAKSLPDDVKHQIDLYIQFTEIEFNKKVLNEKLNEVLTATKDPRYEVDFDFKQNTNARLEAIKTLISDLKQEESEIKSEMDDVFIIKKLNNMVDTKEFQLKNLTREFRLKKMNKKTFESLKEKYKAEKNDAEAERTELMMGIKLWIQELKTEKAELIGERKLNKGRLSSKELGQEDFKKVDKEYALKIEKITKKIETLEKLIK